MRNVLKYLIPTLIIAGCVALGFVGGYPIAIIGAIGGTAYIMVNATVDIESKLGMKNVQKDKPKFAEFKDPNGIPYEEYYKEAKEEVNSKFAKFEDPNGKPQEITTLER